MSDVAREPEMKCPHCHVGAEAALDRVEALADEWERAAMRLDIAKGGFDGVANLTARGTMLDLAEDLHAALGCPVPPRSSPVVRMMRLSTTFGGIVNKQRVIEYGALVALIVGAIVVGIHFVD